MLPRPDPIAAIATAPGKGGIGVVRISGYGLDMLALGLLGKKPVPRHAFYSSFLDAEGQTIDQGIALFFSAPHSFTGEDVLELQGHGGPAVMHLLLQRCLELGARLAQPGEFTQRAFLNDKLDLAQAESVADLIDATSSQAVRSAMRSLQGDFSKAIHQLVQQLIELRMLVEAMLDFPDEEIHEPDMVQRNARFETLAMELEKILERAQQGSLLREGAHIALVGRPNVGKSSLLNSLSGEEVALVSEIPGTTRDVIRQDIQIEGVPFHILDTAGLRASQDVVEQMGMARTRSTLQKADAIIVLLDATTGILPEDQKILEDLPPGIPHLFVHNKIDIAGFPERTSQSKGECHIYLSAKTGAGLSLLRDKLLDLVGWHREEGVFMARERHLRALLAAQNHLLQAAKGMAQPELFAEELRLAQEQMGTITGEFTADDLLGEIFSRFCIGK